MALINYKDIDFKKSIDKELKTFDFNGSEIAVVPYLSINDKYDLIMVALQKSFEKGIYNNIKLDMYFDLGIVYMYTNIQFDSDDRADEAELYDTLKRSGLMEKIFEQIDEKEIENLYAYLFEVKEELLDYKGSLISFLGDLIDTLPQRAESALGMLKNMDPELLKTFTQGSLGTIFKIDEAVNKQEEN
jgi:hypothetical protein